MIDRLVYAGVPRSALPDDLSSGPQPIWLGGAAARRALGAAEALVLVTCERAEVYGVGVDDGHAALLARRLDAALRNAAPGTVPATGRGRAAAVHLTRVAAGLESRIVGECHILGQIARAVDRDADAGSVGPALRRLAADALACGRRVRCETALGRLDASYVALAVARVRRVRGRGDILVLGSGALARDVVAALDDEPRRVVVAARHRGRGLAAIAARGERPHDVVDVSTLPAAVARADVVIAATASARPLVRREHVRRRRRPLLLIDLGAPPNVAEDVTGVAGVDRVGLADLAPARAPGCAAVRRAEQLVHDAVDGVARWCDAGAAIARRRAS